MDCRGLLNHTPIVAMLLLRSAWRIESLEHSISITNEKVFLVFPTTKTPPWLREHHHRIMGIIKETNQNHNQPLLNPHSLKRHTLPQLPLPLPRLQLQPTNSIAQPLLLLPQLAHLQRLQIAQTSPRHRRRSSSPALPRALPAAATSVLLRGI
jgi:hypothetical protein